MLSSVCDRKKLASEWTWRGPSACARTPADEVVVLEREHDRARRATQSGAVTFMEAAGGTGQPLALWMKKTNLLVHVLHSYVMLRTLLVSPRRYQPHGHRCRSEFRMNGIAGLYMKMEFDIVHRSLGDVVLDYLFR
ncbi:hypothetical protein NL676_022734 [Syzygium grande]|nr:hypothetical protein NL676_022734 [Syzygium grande]